MSYSQNLKKSLNNLLNLGPVHAGVLLDLPPQGGQQGGVDYAKFHAWERDPPEGKKKVKETFNYIIICLLT